MKEKFIKYACLMVLLFIGIHLDAQQEAVSRSSSPQFTLRGSVLDTETMQPVYRVNVEITGGGYTTTGLDGEFTIRARVGDELVIRGDGFDPVFYTIKDRQRIRVEIQPLKEEADVKKEKKTRETSFNVLLSQARQIYKRDGSAAIDYVAKALAKEDITVAERAESFEVLAQIYAHLKQYDLAISNYKQSIKNESTIEREIALARTYFLNKSYQESIGLYNTLSRKRLTNTQKLTINEGLGDAYAATGEYRNSIQNYNAVTESVSSSRAPIEQARINTKIAEVYDTQGEQKEAITYYDKALKLTDKEASETAVRAKTKVADFYSKNKSYDEEINLRKAALQDLSDVQFDSIPNDDAITPQKQNYKIGRAYAAQQKYDEAIPFFEKSIDEATSKEDLIVEKDARLRLSELYRNKGDYKKATESYEKYKEVIDLSYSRKEQEISQATRFGKEIAEKQNRITSLEKDRALNESRYELVKARDTRQKIIIGSLAIVTALLLLTAFSMYRSSKQQKYANNLLALKSLRSQMNPHFIFNALNSVNSFIATSDERTANRYLSDFSILMRAVLENSEEDFIPLSNEIGLIEKYVMLEHFRFKDKFDYEVTVDENLDTDAFMIPPMLLQPYVENAVWHGLRYKEVKGMLKIHFGQIDKNTAIVTVTDDGVGRTRSRALKTENQKKQKSKGMGNIKKRIAILNEMYSDRLAVTIDDVELNGEGTRVALILKKV